MAELQHSKEFLEEVNSTVVRQTPMITGDFDISRQIWHARELLTERSQFAELLAIEKTPIPSGQNAILGHILAPDPSHSTRWFGLSNVAAHLPPPRTQPERKGNTKVLAKPRTESAGGG